VRSLTLISSVNNALGLPKSSMGQEKLFPKSRQSFVVSTPLANLSSQPAWMQSKAVNSVAFSQKEHITPLPGRSPYPCTKPNHPPIPPFMSLSVQQEPLIIPSLRKLL
jgi:hypothetical protein